MSEPEHRGARPAPVTPPHWTDLDSLAAGRHNFDVVEIVGTDAVGYLQSQISQDLDRLDIGASEWSFVLDPTGKVTALVRVRRLGEDHLALDTDPGHGGVLLERIKRFMIRVAAEVHLVEGSGEIDPAAERQRIVLGWPRHGHEIEAGATIPAATGLVDAAISFTKGCYPGQELVERMDSRSASAPMSLRRLVVDIGSVPGDVVFGDDGAEIGRLTSVAETDALAYVARRAHLGDPVDFGRSGPDIGR